MGNDSVFKPIGSLQSVNVRKVEDKEVDADTGNSSKVRGKSCKRSKRVKAPNSWSHLNKTPSYDQSHRGSKFRRNPILYHIPTKIWVGSLIGTRMVSSCQMTAQRSHQKFYYGSHDIAVLCKVARFLTTVLLFVCYKAPSPRRQTRRVMV